MKICTVIVTFNRKDMLKECIQGVLNQTVPELSILIIDNNSTDGTEELIKTHFAHLPQLEYINLKQNTGGAGGFHYGVKTAFERGYDWLWLMDDDVEPEPNTLELMLNQKRDSLCIHPTKIHTENGSVFPWNHMLNTENSMTLRYSHEQYDKPGSWKALNVGCFEGMLIHRDIISKIGFPDERFFIAGDDLIYGYLASQHTPVIYLRDPVFKKKIYKEEDFSYFLGLKRRFQSPFFLYFNARNHFLKKDYLVQYNNSSPMKINKILFAKSLKLLIEVVFFYRSFQHIKMLYWGLLDGVKRDFMGHKRFIK